MMRADVLKSMLAFALVTLGHSFTNLAGAADVQIYKISKGIEYQQLPERAPTNLPASAFVFEATVLMNEPGSVSGARVKPKGSRPVRTLLPNGERELRFVNRPSRKSVLEERFPNGNFTFTIDTRNDGQRSLRLALTNNAYPPAPFVHHLVELQAVNANGHLVVSWQPFVNGTAADFIRLRIEDTAGALAWESRGLGERGALDGTATWAIIQPGALRPGTVYNATLLFEKFVTRDALSYPEALGVSSYYRRTRFTITTTSEGPADVDRYELSKGERFEQDDISSAPDSKRDEFIFLAEVHAREPGLLLVASLTTTLESVIPLVPDAERADFEFSQTMLDGDTNEVLFPPGNYVFGLQTATQGNRRVGLWFDEDNHPPEPRFRGDPTQVFSRDVPFILAWDRWPSGTRDDFIHLRIEDEDGKTIFETPDFDDPDALSGSATNVTIPAGILFQAEEHMAFLTFRRFNRMNWFDYPGALGVSSIFSTTEFEIQTIRPDLEEYSIARGQGFEQEGDGPPVPDPNDEFIFDAQVEASSDNAISSATLITPRGASIPMDPNPPDEFEFSDTAPTLAAFNAIYPVGNYRFNIQGRQGALSVLLNVPASPYPPAPHPHLVALGRPEPGVPVTITWDPWDGGTTNDFIQVRIQNEDGDTVFETPNRGDDGALNGLATSVTVPPGPDIFRLGDLYEGRIRFERFVVDGEETLPGAEGTVSYFSRTDFDIQAFGPDVEDYRIERGQRFVQTTTDPPVRDLNDEFEFSAEVQGSAPDLISSVSLTTPLGGVPIVLDPNNAFDEFDFSEQVPTQAELDAAYPPGLYTFIVQSDNGTPNLPLNVPTSEFPQVPHLQFDPNVSIPGNRPLILSWHQWADGTEADFIRLRIEDAAGDVVFETPTLNSAGALNGRATSVTIDAGTLDAGQIYEGQLTFARIVVRDETTLPGAEGRVTFSSRTDFDIRVTGIDVEDYRIERGQRFEQTTAGPPVPDPGGEFEFNAEVQGSAPNVILLATLRPPSGPDIPLEPNNPRDEFEFSDRVSTQEEFDTLYPPGSYAFLVQSSNQLSQTIPLEVPASAFPPAPHVQFNPGTRVPADQPLLLRWDAWAGGTTNDFIQLRVEDAEGDVVFETPDRGDAGALNGESVSVTIPAGGLLPGESYEARLVFERVVFTTNDMTDAEGRVTYFARTDFNIETVPGDLEDYRLERGRRFEQTTVELPVPDLDDEFEFNAEVQGSAPNRISSAILTTPLGTNIVLEPNNDFDEFEFSDHASTQLEFDSLYPPGPYEFSIQRVNQGAKTILLIVPTNDFPPAPHVVFDPRTEVPPYQPLTIFWDRWIDGGADDFVQFRIEDAANNVVFETPDRGDAGALNGESVSVTIPAGRLAPVQSYEGRLVFERILLIDEATVPGAEGRVTYFARTDFDIETSPGDIEDYRIERGRRFEQTTAGLPLPDPGDEFEFNAEVQGSKPNLISSATLRTPPSTVIVLDPNNDFDEFEFSDQVSTQAEFDTLYPLGTYEFAVQSVNQGSQTIPLEVPASDFPPAPHVQFDPGTMVPADQPLLLQWDAWAGGATNDFIQVRIEDADGDVVFETPDRGDDGALNGLSTSTSFPAATLVPGQSYEARLVFERIVLTTNDASGAEGRVTYFARTDFDIETVPGDVEDYRIERGRRFEQTTAGPPVPDPGDEFEFNAEVQGSAPNRVSSAILTTPPGTNIVLEPNNDFDEFEFSDQVSAQAEFDILYPDSTYTFTVQGVNQGTQTIPLIAPQSDFPPAPHVQFDPRTEIAADQDAELRWDFWVGSGADDFIQLRIEDANNNVVFETPDRGEAGALNGASVSVTIPAGTLAPIQRYEGRLVFERIVLTDETTVPGAEGRVIHFARTDFDIETSGGDVEDYRIERGRRFEQATAGLPVPDPGDEFEFNAEVQGSAPNLITLANLRTPPSAVIVLEPNSDFDEFEFSDQVSTQAEFDSLYPAGTYSFIVQSVNQGTQTIPLDVPASEFPPAPHVQFDPGTEVPANLELLLFWDAWVGGTNDDFIQLRIEDADDNVVFETPDRGDAGALNGLATATVIPAGTLVPGQTYEGRLIFERIVLTDESTVPGAEGRVIYFARTDFDIETFPLDVQEYEVFKEHVYVQTSNGPPAATEFVFRALVEAESDVSVLGAAITPPTGLQVQLVQGGGGDEFALQDSHASQEILDANYPDGEYLLMITGVNDGTRFIPGTITGAMYPSAPQLSDYDAAQSVNAAAAFVLAWNPFLDGTAQDHIDVQIEDSAGNEVFDTPGHGNDGALDGLATSVTIPPFTLQPAQAYEVRILFQKILRANDSGYPGVVGRVGYSARTFAGIATAAVANPPPPRIQNYQALPDGSLQFNVVTPNGGTYQIQGSPNMIDWTTLGTLSATSGLSTFTVPPPPSVGCYFYRATLMR